jgi:phosphate transport system substrate-binding protein
MIRRLLITATLVVTSLTLSLTGCKSSGGPEVTTLSGAGSTFAYPLYSAWASEYGKLHPEIQVNYQSIGSGGGIVRYQRASVAESTHLRPSALIADSSRRISLS